MQFNLTQADLGLLKSKKVGTNWVSKINYPNCTNYEGNKILVTSFYPGHKSSLDPHFCPNSGIIARFEPTDEGFENALNFAELIK